MTFTTALRVFSRSAFRHISRTMTTKPEIAEKIANMTPTELIKNTVKVSDWNKGILVFAGRYKSKAEVPDIIPFETLDKARNRVRIKVCNIMIALTIVGSIVMVISGKEAAEHGESVTKMNLDWHKEYNEKARQEEEARQKAALP